MRQRKRLNRICKRGFEGMGTPGAYRTSGNWVYRFLAVTSILLGALYLVWRACRSLTGGWCVCVCVGPVARGLMVCGGPVAR